MGEQLSPEEATPRLQIVRGDATPEEIAALVATLTAVVAARADAIVVGDSGQPAQHPAWNSPARLLRTPLHPGPGAWRRSAWG